MIYGGVQVVDSDRVDLTRVSYLGFYFERSETYPKPLHERCIS